MQPYGNQSALSFQHYYSTKYLKGVVLGDIKVVEVLRLKLLKTRDTDFAVSLHHTRKLFERILKTIFLTKFDQYVNFDILHIQSFNLFINITWRIYEDIPKKKKNHVKLISFLSLEGESIRHTRHSIKFFQIFFWKAKKTFNRRYW